MILRLILQYMVNVQALRNNPISTIGRLLDAVVHVRVLGGKYEEHDLWTELIGVPNRGEECLHSLAPIIAGLLNDWRYIMNLAAMAAINLNKVAYKGLDRLLGCPVQYIRKFSKTERLRERTVGNP